MPADRTDHERELFDEWVRTFWKDLYGGARRKLWTQQEAEDVVQDVFTRTWFAPRQLTSIDNPRAWLWRTLHNLVANRVRDRSARPEDPAGDDLPDAGVEASDDAVALGVGIRRALAVLSDQQRELVWLHYYNQFTYPEAAAILGIPVGTVRSSLSDARRRLREAAQMWADD